MSLLNAVELLLAFVAERRSRGEFTTAEVAEFKRLDEEVYLLATQSNLQAELPQFHVMERAVSSVELSIPPKLLGHSNLPGDWDQMRFMFVEDLWIETM